MAKKRPLVPIGLPLSGIILLAAGLLLRPVVQNTFSEEVLTKNTILNGIPFILIFVAIVLFFISAIWLLGSVINYSVPPRLYRTIESVIIAGIVLGVLGMFQPWWFIGFRYGFHLLLASTLSFMVWSHIIPKGKRVEDDSGPPSISEFEQKDTALPATK